MHVVDLIKRSVAYFFNYLLYHVIYEKTLPDYFGVPLHVPSIKHGILVAEWYNYHKLLFNNENTYSQSYLMVQCKQHYYICVLCLYQRDQQPEWWPPTLSILNRPDRDQTWGTNMVSSIAGVFVFS